jgi:hypothetical protein
MSVSSNVSNKNLDVCQTVDSPWDIATSDAQAEITLLARKKARLQQAIRIFKANKKEGVQWPGKVTPLQKE